MKPISKPFVLGSAGLAILILAFVVGMMLLRLFADMGLLEEDEGSPVAAYQVLMFDALPYLSGLLVLALIGACILAPLPMADRLARLSTGIGKFASFLILPLVILIIFDVITRKIDYISKGVAADITETYGFSISFLLQDLQWHFHGALLLLTFGFGYLMNAHVRVDIFREALERRKQVWVETFGLVICALPFMALMIWFSWVMASSSLLQNEGSESQVGLGERWIIKSFLIWGFVVAAMAALATLIRCLKFLYGSYDEQAEAEDDLQFFTDVQTLPKVVLEDDSTRGAGGV